MKENGFEYMDLGLSSGTMWATCNVGANNPEDPGLLFQFGRVDGYKYGDENNKFSTPDENKKSTWNKYVNPTTSGTKYAAGQKLSLKDDAAHVNMGGKWITPTKDDFQELYDNTTRTVEIINGKKGILFTSNINGKSIFIALAGCWNYYSAYFFASGYAGYLRSSDVCTPDSEYSCCLVFNACGDCDLSYDFALANGFSVRGVLKK